MLYCVEHNNKSYTEKQFDKIHICEQSGSYQGVEDGKIRVYCFKALYGKKATCLHNKEEIKHERHIKKDSRRRTISNPST